MLSTIKAIAFTAGFHRLSNKEALASIPRWLSVTSPEVLRIRYTGLVFNKTYHARAMRGGLVSAGAIVEEIVERAADRRRSAAAKSCREAFTLSCSRTSRFRVTPTPLRSI
jgi:hypothetical protein